MHRSRRSPRTRLAVLGLTLVLGALGACGLGAPGEKYSMPTGDTGTNTKSPLSNVGMESLSANRSIPVYWLGKTDGTVSLYREFVRVAGAADPIADSVRYILTEKPEDPDYFSLWHPSETVGASVSPDNVITIDISAKAFGAKLDAGLAERAIAQLVFTATAAASNAGILSEGLEPSVRILVDGQPDYAAFGHVALDHNFVRDPKLAAPLWVIDPQYGTTQKAGKVTFHGVSAKFSGGENWKITRRDSEEDPKPVVATGTLQTGDGALDHNEFSFSYVLAPGDYTFSLWGIDAGSNKALAKETKDFTVTK
ncbi:MAG: GerMN domain-containing protein [Micrococcaceae bacterium]|nr:GerMN domain-containing protein [Micrococcaceae bacterium]